MEKALLGIDIGTTSVKVLLICAQTGVTLEKVKIPYESLRPQTGWVEQDPDDWTRAIAAAWKKIKASHPNRTLISIGICSQVNTHLLVDKNSKPLTPAITWKDLRCAKIASDLDSSITEIERIKLWGGPFKIDASFSLSRIKWWQEHSAAEFSNASAIMLPKDYVISVICGVQVADPLSAIGLVDSNGKYLSDVLSMIDGAERLCAPLAPFNTVAGLTNGALGLPPNIPVAVGTMDAWGNVYGSGLQDASFAMQISGTSEIVGILSKNSKPTPGIISFPAFHGRSLHAGPTQAGADALAWFAQLHSKNIEVVLDAAEAAPESRVYFLPHLDGERAPHWNSNAQGVFIGLSRGTGFGEMARAVLEGVAFAARQVLEGCETAAISKVDTIQISGGGARSSYWNQIKANILQRQINVLAELDTGALGIALVAAGLGRDDLEEWAASQIKINSTINPATDKKAYFDEKFEIYVDSYRALTGIFDRNSSLKK